MSNKLSPTMQNAVDYANEHGGKLIRYPGGFWCRDGLVSWQCPWFGTTTIQALISRGIMEYTKWQEGRSRFPIEVTVITPAPDAQERMSEGDG